MRGSFRSSSSASSTSSSVRGQSQESGTLCVSFACINVTFAKVSNVPVASLRITRNVPGGSKASAQGILLDNPEPTDLRPWDHPLLQPAPHGLFLHVQDRGGFSRRVGCHFRSSQSVCGLGPYIEKGGRAPRPDLGSTPSRLCVKTPPPIAPPGHRHTTRFSWWQSWWQNAPPQDTPGDT